MKKQFLCLLYMILILGVYRLRAAAPTPDAQAQQKKLIEKQTTTSQKPTDQAKKKKAGSAKKEIPRKPIWRPNPTIAKIKKFYIEGKGPSKGMLKMLQEQDRVSYNRTHPKSQRFLDKNYVYWQCDLDKQGKLVPGSEIKLAYNVKHKIFERDTALTTTLPGLLGFSNKPVMRDYWVGNEVRKDESPAAMLAAGVKRVQQQGIAPDMMHGMVTQFHQDLLSKVAEVAPEVVQKNNGTQEVEAVTQPEEVQESSAEGEAETPMIDESTVMESENQDEVVVSDDENN